MNPDRYYKDAYTFVLGILEDKGPEAAAKEMRAQLRAIQIRRERMLGRHV